MTLNLNLEHLCTNMLMCWLDHWHDCGLISQGLLLICIAMGLISTQVFILCLIACLKDIRELKDQRDLLEFELEEMSQLSVS